MFISNTTSLVSRFTNRLIVFVLGAGWGDAIEGLLLSGYIAYKAARSCVPQLSLPMYRAHAVCRFVFSNRTLTDMVEGFSDGDRMPPSHIPYNAIIRGA